MNTDSQITHTYTVKYETHTIKSESIFSTNLIHNPPFCKATFAHVIPNVLQTLMLFTQWTQTLMISSSYHLTHISICTHTKTYTHTRSHTHTHTYTHTHTHTRTHTLIHSLCISMSCPARGRQHRHTPERVTELRLKPSAKEAEC